MASEEEEALPPLFAFEAGCGLPSLLEDACLLLLPVFTVGLWGNILLLLALLPVYVVAIVPPTMRGQSIACHKSTVLNHA